MRSASATYKMVRALDTAWYEWRVNQGNNNYGLDVLKSISVSYALTSGSGISIGNANATKCEMTLMEESANWERMAKFTVQFKIHLGASQTASEWITLGTFYTDERSEDKYGNLSIVAYDAMLMMEQYWTDKIPEQLLPATFPITAKAWATMIQSAGLATFDDLTQLDDTIAFVGLDTTTTIRDVLKTIATAHGGNWIMTTSETLKLVQFVNASSGYSTLGLSTKTLENSPALDAVTGVHLETSAGTVMESGDDDGYVVKAICDVSDTYGVAALCLSRLDGYVFRPFEAGTAYLDPIVEIGDSVSIDSTIYQVMSIDWYAQKMPTANISAPYDQEIDHEYTIPSEQARNYRKTMSAVAEQMDNYVPWDEVSTAIEQNAESVVIAASGTYVTQTEYDETIAEIQNQLDGNIQSWSGNEVPTLNNSPAVDWNTTALKNEHVGDMYFINSDAGIPEAGNYYRFENNEGTYSWQLITDSVATEALARAAAALAAAEGAQDTADAAEAEVQLKGRIFVVQPTPPYNVGDLWFDSDHSEILTCMTARTSGGFASGDWVKRNKYTDDSAFSAFQIAYNDTIAAIQEQIDQKAETYYQDYDPITDWDATIAGIAIAGISVVGFDGEIGMSHKGDLWYRTTDNTTWFWDGTQWVLQEVPDEVFDKIDGKAQVFVNTPYTPYNIGDLWFNSASSEIMTCVVARATGDFVSSDWEKRNKYTDDSSFTTFVNATYNPTIAAIQANLDGKVDTYFYAYAPTLQNAPASQWITDDDKDAHVDDLFFDTVSGYTYRFKKDGSTYSWERIKDEDINAAMEAASTAQDTADGKRRVFVTQPTNADEYDIGDLWVNATYGSIYSNDLLRCKTAKAAGVSFNIENWEKASKYTDDSAFNSFVNSVYTPEIAAIQSNLDGKVDTYFYAYAPDFNKAPTNEWTTSAIRDEHIDDLFYDTSSGYVYRFTKVSTFYFWVRIKDSDITSAMTTASTAQDTADGKRRVFVTTPKNNQAYDVGDLWVNATYGTMYSNDLLRCKTAKAAGITWNINHWELASKYTDDTAADAVGESLTQFISEFSVEPSQIRAEVEKRVIQDQQSTKNTFGWLMNDTSHTWYANNQEVMKVQQSGVSVTGSITATSGYIGNGASGFTINSTEFHNGMTSMSDTTHNGVYIGTNGIALGKGKFKVTSAGSVTASDLTINGGTISIGGTAQNPTFYVDANGNLYAQSGTFTGNVYASNIQYGGAAGTLNGAAITTQTISGGYNGQIDTYTIDDYNISQYTSGGVTYGSLTTSSFSSGVQTSLYQADMFGLATSPSSGEYPSYFCAQSLRALRGVTGNELYVDYGDETTLSVSNHYHRITVNQDGTVTFGVPYNSNTPPSFNVADTHAYRDAVSAVTVTSLDLEYTYDDEMHIYRLMGYAKNQAGTVVYQSTTGQWNTDRSAYVDGKADGADEVTVTTITRTYPDGESSYPYYDSPTLGKIIEFKAIATMSNNHSGAQILTVPATAAYNAGTSDAEDGVTVSLTTSQTGWNSSHIKTISINTAALSSGGTTLDSKTETIQADATTVYEQGQNSVTASASGLTTDSSNYGTYDQAIGLSASSLYTVSGTQYGRIQVTLSNGVTRVVRVGMPAGSAAVDSITVTRISGDMNDWELEDNNVYVGVNLAAKNGSTTVYSTTGRVIVNDIVNFFAPASGTILATETSTANNNYNFEVDTTGYTNAFYRSGNYQYVRFQLKDSDGYNLDIVRVKMASTSSAITEVLALTSDSSSYLNYSRQASFYASSLYTPSGSSTTYARVQVNLNSGSSEIIRVALPASQSVTVTDIESHCTSADYSDYWQNSLGQWMLRVRAMSNSTVLYEKSLNIQHAVNYGKEEGGTLTWNIYQHYDMGEPDGWDCTVTTGSGQTHTFWSSQRIYA